MAPRGLHAEPIFFWPLPRLSIRPTGAGVNVMLRYITRAATATKSAPGSIALSSIFCTRKKSPSRRRPSPAACSVNALSPVADSRPQIVFELLEHREYMEAGEAEADPDRRAGDHVAQEMHSQDDARSRNQKRRSQQTRFQYMGKRVPPTSPRRNAVMECPEGNEYLSGGNIDAQQCGSISQGLLRRLVCFRVRNRKIPAAARKAPAAERRQRCSPPIDIRMRPSAYHSHPSPLRVAKTINMRNHRGARQRCTRRISR